MVIRENYLNILIDAKDTEFIKVITGVRRSGKSTLLLMYKDHLLNNNISEERIIHINFESAMYDYIKNYKDLYEYIKNKLSKEKTYILLGLATYFTVGADEVKAWTFKKGMKAPECAGLIHSDFEKGFIRAEVMSYDDLIKCGSELKVRESGKMRLEGKDYVMQDGDICHFRFNV